MLAEAQLAAACAREAALLARLAEAQARIAALEQAAPMRPAQPVHIGVCSLGLRVRHRLFQQCLSSSGH